MKDKLLLACESSCDETAFSLFNMNEGKILESIILSQSEIHSRNGGVIPELASYYHYKVLSELFEKILIMSSKAIADISVFAATQGPGLPGALSLGFSFTKSLAWVKNKEFIPVNHLEGHVYSSFLSHKDIPFPHLCISLSGGHTSVFYVESLDSYKCLGTTRDDACGECFDKVAKLLLLGYPGGYRIEELAKKREKKNFRRYPISDLGDGSISFSGLKTAVYYDLMKLKIYDVQAKKIFKETSQDIIEDVAASLQYVISQMIQRWILYFLDMYTIKAVTLVGGVACNSIIRDDLKTLLFSKGISFFVPEKKYCCDNADMIAFVANKKYLLGEKNYFFYEDGIFI